MKYILLLLTLVVILAFNNICFANEATLQRAWSYYLRGDYRKTASACRIISRDRMLGEEGRYIMGLSLLKLGNLQGARKNFSFVLDNYPNSKIRDAVLLGIADSYYLEGKFDKAEEYCIRLLKNFPGTGYASIACLRMGESQRKQGKWEKADSSFYKVVRDYPFSLEERVARAYLKKKTDFFSIQIGAFSKKGNAQKLSKLLRKKGYDGYIVKSYKKDRLIYRVRVGKFGTRKRADDEAAKLKKEGFTVRICT